MKRILFTGGGSGGHIFPLIAVAEELKKLSDVELYYLGPPDEFSAILNGSGIRTRALITGKIRRRFLLQNVLDVPKFFIGLVQAFFKLYFLMPDAVFSKGGTGAFPVVLAAWFYMIPVVIHDSDTVPGLNNLLSARFAKRIAIAFESAARYFNPNKTIVTGNPVRSELFARHLDANDAKSELGFAPDAPLIFVICGSQGAVRINEFLLANLKDILPISQIFHQTGTSNYADVKKLSQAALLDMPLATEAASRYKAVPFLDANQSGLALSAADIVVARAGSGTLSEIAAFGKASILIPLPQFVGRDQRTNAYEFARNGGAIVVEEENLNLQIILNHIKAILSNESLKSKMGQTAAEFYRPQASIIVAKEILDLA